MTTIDEKIIKYLKSWSNIPIPVNQNYEYYLNILDKYYDSKKILKLILTDVDNFGSISILTEHTYNVMQIIIDDLKSKTKYQQFIQYKASLKAKSANFGKLYTEINHNKLFISIDIRSANFTIINQFDPTFFDGFTNWTDYISKFTKSLFLRQSKPFRELIFGKLFGNCDSIFIETISNVSQFIKEFYKEDTIFPEHRSPDEIVYRVMGEKPELIYNELKNAIEKKYPNIFHIKMFRLIRLGKKPYYVKEHSTSSVELKCIPKKIVCQCIRYYQKERPLIDDLKFMDEDMVVTYDKPIPFD